MGDAKIDWEKIKAAIGRATTPRHGIFNCIKEADLDALHDQDPDRALEVAETMRKHGWKLYGQNNRTTDVVTLDAFRERDDGQFVRLDPHGRICSQFSYVHVERDGKPLSVAARRCYAWLVQEVFREKVNITEKPDFLKVVRPVSAYMASRGITDKRDAKKELRALCRELHKSITVTVGDNEIGTALLNEYKVDDECVFSFNAGALEMMRKLGPTWIHEGLFSLNLQRYPLSFPIGWKLCVQHKMNYNEDSRFRARQKRRREVERVKVSTVLGWTKLGDERLIEYYRNERQERARIIKPLESALDGLKEIGMGEWCYVVTDKDGDERTASRGELKFSEFMEARIEFTFSMDYPTASEIGNSHERARDRKKPGK